MLENLCHRLSDLLSRPSKPTYCEGDWDEFQSNHSIVLPSDYKWFVSSYGFGRIIGPELLIESPFHALQDHAEMVIDGIARWREADEVPFKMTLADGGYYSCGMTLKQLIGVGGNVGWLRRGDPDTWQVVVEDAAGARPYQTGLVSFLIGMLSRAYPELDSWFDGYEGGPPYPYEALLQPSGIPTHPFKTTAGTYGWLDASVGHGLRLFVSLPPRFEARPYPVSMPVGISATGWNPGTPHYRPADVVIDFSIEAGLALEAERTRLKEWAGRLPDEERIDWREESLETSAGTCTFFQVIREQRPARTVAFWQAPAIGGLIVLKIDGQVASEDLQKMFGSVRYS